jgi:hypothetical protein
MSNSLSVESPVVCGLLGDTQGFSEADFRSWDKRKLVSSWHEEVIARQLPPADPTLLLTNAEVQQGGMARLSEHFARAFKLRRKAGRGAFGPAKDKYVGRSVNSCCP